MSKIDKAIDLLQQGIDVGDEPEAKIMQEAIDILSESKPEQTEFRKEVESYFKYLHIPIRWKEAALGKGWPRLLCNACNEIDSLTEQRDYKDKAIKQQKKKQKNQAEEINRLSDENAKFIKFFSGCSTCKDQYEAGIVKLEARIKAKDDEIAKLRKALGKCGRLADESGPKTNIFKVTVPIGNIVEQALK